MKTKTPSSVLRCISEAVHKRRTKALQNIDTHSARTPAIPEEWSQPLVDDSLPSKRNFVALEMMSFTRMVVAETSVGLRRIHKADKRHVVMSRTVSTVEKAIAAACSSGVLRMEWLTDGAKYCLFTAAIAAALHMIRRYAPVLGDAITILKLKPWEFESEAARVGRQAGYTAQKNLSTHEVFSSSSRHDRMLHPVAWQAAVTTIKNISLDDGTQESLILRVVDAIEAGIREGIAIEAQFNTSFSVLQAAMTASLTVARLGIEALYQESQNKGEMNWSEFRSSMAEVESIAIEAGIVAGTAANAYSYECEDKDKNHK
ncbi:hypothetical protein F5Y16DRAFT_393528 [Xylariaceae sp. FL0255]|nr:hypothetical protein F5Y16DRAFT_393528 [Xylariaceae sp. FL0255]